MSIDFPDWVKRSDCKTASNSEIKRTPHGIVKTTKTGEISTGKVTK